MRRWRAGGAGQLARLSDLYLKQGDRLKSRSTYQQSLRLDPSNRELRELLAGRKKAAKPGRQLALKQHQEPSALPPAG